jgi:hypothetical protein
VECYGRASQFWCDVVRIIRHRLIIRLPAVLWIATASHGVPLFVVGNALCQASFRFLPSLTMVPATKKGRSTRLAKPASLCIVEIAFAPGVIFAKGRWLWGSFASLTREPVR